VPPSFSGYQALRAPPLTGPCALRGFTSAAELLAYVRYNMPIQAPGSLSNGEARDVVAFILARNEIQGAQPLTLAHARTIALADRPGGAACARR
jgi:hypothetical protein